MVNVLHLINYAGWGSPEKYIITLAEKLHRKSCRFYLGYFEEGPLLKQAAQLGIQTVHIPSGGVLNSSAAFKVRDACRELSIDIIHSHSLRENFIAALSKLLGNRAVLISTNHLMGRKNLLLLIYGTLADYLTDRIIAVSSAVKRQIEQGGIKPDKVEVINYGVDAEVWTGKRNFLFRREMGIGREEYVITTVSRFTESDGLIFLLETAKLLKKMASSGVKLIWRTRFVIVGDGELMDETKKLASMLGLSEDIIFTGARTDLKNVFLSSDIYVSARENEQPELSLLEAMACELPVIAVEGGGASELINGPDRCGILVEYGDTDAFVRAIMEMAVNRRIYNYYKANTSRIVREKYNLDMSVDQTYNLYIKTLGDRQKSLNDSNNMRF